MIIIRKYNNTNKPNRTGLMMMSNFNVSPAIPILRIFSEEKAREFYLDFLGFSVDWEYRHTDELPLYMQVSLEKMTLHLSEHHGDSIPGVRLFIPIEKIEGFHATLEGQSYRFSRPELVSRPWGGEVEVADPFGNRLTFCRQQSNAS